MRIGMVTGEYYPMRGGVGDFSRELALALCRHSHEVHVITHVSGSNPPGALLASSFSLHPSIPRWSFPALIKIRHLARQFHLDLINLQYQTLAYGMTLPIHFLPRLAGLPVVVTFHDLRAPYLFPKAGSLRAAAVQTLAHSAAGVIVTNPEDEQTLKVVMTSVVQIPIGSNIQVNPPPGYDREQWRAGMGLRTEEMLIGFFGFLKPGKGEHILSAAMQLLLARGLPVRLILIGGRPPSPATASGAVLTDDVSRVTCRVSRDTLLTGYLDPPEVSAHLLACDVMVLPYLLGATLRSGSFMAALLHGCAIVITEPQVAIPELEDGKNVRLIPREDSAATAAAIAELLASPELRARLSSGARDLARKFDWEGIASRTAAFYDEILR